MKKHRWTGLVLLGVLASFAGCDQAKEPVLRDSAKDSKGEAARQEARQAQYKMPGMK